MGLYGGMKMNKGKSKAENHEIGEHCEGMDSPGKFRVMRALGQLGQVDLGEGLHAEEIQKRVEEEGIGVSPRGKKIIKYSGKG